MEDELRVGPADGDGVVARGALNVGVLYLEVVGSGVSAREGGVDCHEDHEEVRPVEIFALLRGGRRS
jgi:hypothetical protein